MKQVFICYSRKDAEPALKIYTELLAYQKDLSPWIDKHNLLPGIKWRPAIRKAIRESDYFIAMLSSKSVDGRGIRNAELNEALDILDEFREDSIFLIPIRLDECEMPFQKLEELNYLDMFPKWNEGMKKLLSIFGKGKDLRKNTTNDKVEENSKYQYRIGLVDLDIGISNLKSIVNKLNEIQQFFLFTYPTMPVLGNTTKTINGIKNFAVYEVPKSFIEEHRYLAVDLIACLTKYPLAFKEDNSLLYNYFAGPSDIDERFFFISTDHLYDFCKEANCTFEKGIINILVGQVIGYFTKLGYHEETIGCLMDFCSNRADMIIGLRESKLCEVCLKKIYNEDLKKSILAMLNWDN